MQNICLENMIKNVLQDVNPTKPFFIITVKDFKMPCAFFGFDTRWRQQDNEIWQKKNHCNFFMMTKKRFFIVNVFYQHPGLQLKGILYVTSWYEIYSQSIGAYNT